MKVPPWTFIWKCSSLSQLFTVYNLADNIFWLFAQRYRRTHSTHDVVKSVPDFWHFLKRINGWPSLRYCLLQALSCMYTQSKCVKWSFHRAAKSYLLRRLTGKSQVAEKSHFISFSERNISIKDWLKFHFWRADRKFLKNAPFLFCCSCSNENGNVSFFS